MSSPKKTPKKVPEQLQEENKLQSVNVSQSKEKTSNLGLIESQDEEESEQTKHVEMDLCKNIMTMARSKQVVALCGLAGAFMVHLVVGAIYRWNMITGYVRLYYGTNSETPVGAPLVMLCAGLTMRLGYKLSNAVGSKWIIAIGVITATISVIVASTMKTFPLFLFFHNVIYGLSAGLIFLPALKECHKFFPQMKLVTNSIVLSGTGLGAVLFGAYNIECIQADNPTYQLEAGQLQELIEGYFTVCFLKMGLMVFVVGFIGFSLMVPMINRNQQREREAHETSAVPKEGKYCKSEWLAFQSRVFWVIAIIVFLTSCGNFYVIMNFKNLLSAQHQQKLFLYWVLISGALGNGVSRVFWGFLSSRLGFKMLYTTAAVLNISSFIVIMVSSSETVYLIFYTLNSISLGGMMVIVPNLSLLAFGKKIGESIYSYYWMAFSLGNFFQFFITLILTNNPTTSDDYGEVLFFFVLCVIGAVVLCCCETLQGPWKNSLDLIEFRRNSRKYST